MAIQDAFGVRGLRAAGYVERDYTRRRTRFGKPGYVLLNHIQFEVITTVKPWDVYPKVDGDGFARPVGVTHARRMRSVVLASDGEAERHAYSYADARARK